MNGILVICCDHKNLLMIKEVLFKLKSQNIFLSKRFFTTIPARYLLLPCRQSLYSIQNPCLYCYEISLCCIQIETYSFRLEQLQISCKTIS